MRPKKLRQEDLTEADLGLLCKLHAQPELRARIEHILTIADAHEGPLQTADQVEEDLLQAIRQLGHETLTHWARQAEARVGEELRAEDPTVRSRKKNR